VIDCRPRIGGVDADAADATDATDADLALIRCDAMRCDAMRCDVIMRCVCGVTVVSKRNRADRVSMARGRFAMLF